ncbi:MAG TPA: PAS domain S-box protein [Candidatus Rifleibacterium sp.]|nr:PAS domain S-box protein [Candidatus Rifleibacterium sp.]HPT46475.1 PAS domain S-box protein [Candidatus Rifleibacterium sp.]
MSVVERLRSQAFDNLPVPVMFIDVETSQIVDCNPAAITACGFSSRESTLGKTILDFSASHQYDGSPSSQTVGVFLKKALDEGVAVFDWQHRKCDGTLWDAEVHLHTVRFDNRDFYQCTIIDITARKKQEFEQRQSESKFRKFFDLPLVGLVVTSVDMSFIEANNRFCTMLGYERHELNSITWADLTAPDGRADEQAKFERFIASELDSYLLVKKFMKKDGSLVDVILSGTCLRNPDNSVSCLVAAVQDITEIRRMESLVSENREIFSLFMRNSPIMAYVKEMTEDDCIVLQASDSFVSLIGRGGQDILGKNMYDLFPAEFAAKIIADDHAVVAGKKILHLEEEFDDRFFTTIKFPISLGKRTLLAGYTIDITEQKRISADLQKEKQFVEKLLDCLPALFYIYDSDLKLRRWNRKHRELLGYTDQELNGMPLDAFYASSVTLVKVKNKIRAAIENDSFEQIEAFLATKDGGQIPFLLTGMKLDTDKGPMLMGVGVDISEPKRIENALRRNEKLLSDAQRISKIGSWSYDYASKHNECSDEVLRIFECEQTGMPSGLENFRSRVHPDDLAMVNSVADRLREIRQPYEFDFRLLFADGHCKYVHAQCETTIAENGRPVVSIGTIQDITDRVLLEQTLRENEEKSREQTRIREAYDRLTTIMDSMDALVYIVDLQTHELLFVNSYGTKIWGNIIGQVCWKSIQKNQTGPCSYCPNSRLVDQNGKPTGVYQWEFKNTINNRWYDCRDVAIRWIDGRVVKMEVATDITMHKDAENALREVEIIRESETRIRKALEYLPVPIVLTDSAANLVFQNRQFFATYGYQLDEIPTVSSWMERVFPDAGKRAVIEKSWNEKVESSRRGNGLIAPAEYEVTCRNGEVKTVEISACIEKDMAIGMFVDISERKRIEIALRNVQKLESLGVLAGGIAHDFNNLVGGIFGFIDLARTCSKEARVTDYLDKAMGTMERARGLTQQLLTFARGGVPLQKVARLFPFIQETAQFALSGSKVSVSFDIPDDIWLCNYDRSQIGQVFDNLIINAQQAMPLGGTIVLSARNVTFPEKGHPLLPMGNYVRVSVQDSGIGISKDLLSKVFDPFFTTKSKGHGLGLTTCYSIVNRHGGCIDVESEPGRGSVFHVFLPATQETAVEDARVADSPHHGVGRILLMDDEETIRETVGGMLESIGYSVVAKDNGRAAIEFYRAEKLAGRDIAAMIFDLTIPGGMGGIDAVTGIRRLDTEIPIFVASGYANDPVMKNPSVYGFTASISKPFRLKDLAEMLARHLKAKKH